MYVVLRSVSLSWFIHSSIHAFTHPSIHTPTHPSPRPTSETQGIRWISQQIGMLATKTFPEATEQEINGLM